MFDRDLNLALFFTEELLGYQFHHMVTDSLSWSQDSAFIDTILTKNINEKKP